MNPVKFLGILCMCLGVATMFLGTAMVPVATPVWADMDIGLPACTGHDHCKTAANPCTLSGQGCTTAGCDTNKQGCGGCTCKAPSSDPSECKCRA
jgi:hypothetical protein